MTNDWPVAREELKVLLDGRFWRSFVYIGVAVLVNTWPAFAIVVSHLR